MSIRECKLAVIYNVFDGVELLWPSIQTVYEYVDLVIIVYQEISNRGEVWSPMPLIGHLQELDKVLFVKFDPRVEMGAQLNERAKRNLGIDFARANHCTHFLAMDVDEFYWDFKQYKQFYLNTKLQGSVVRLQSYFKKPTLMFDKPEDYFVPFIHELKEDTLTGASSYKFYVDPTRAINTSDVIELPFFMDHFSWVRKDIKRKIRNSSAPIQNNKIAIEDYKNAEEGYFLKNWNRTLKACHDKYNLSQIFEQP